MRKAVWLVVLMFFMEVSLGWASPFNIRPVTVNDAPQGEDSLQTIFNNISLSNYDVEQDQNPAAIFTHTASSSTASSFIVEFAGLKDENEIGIYDYTSQILAPLFLGDYTAQNNWAALNGWQPVDNAWKASSGFQASVTFKDGYITVTYKDSGGNVILFEKDDNIAGSIKFDGFGDTFGFYLRNSYGTFYSEDDRNPNNEAHVLAFRGDGQTRIEDNTYGSGVSGTFDTFEWIFAFEDLPGGSADWDYNDAVILVESIEPIPEPATMLLVGAGLIGISFLGRRKIKK